MVLLLLEEIENSISEIVELMFGVLDEDCDENVFNQFYVMCSFICHFLLKKTEFINQCVFILALNSRKKKTKVKTLLIKMRLIEVVHREIHYFFKLFIYFLAFIIFTSK